MSKNKKKNFDINLELNTCLGKRGYSVLKEELTSTQIQKIRKDLTVQAFVNQDYGAKPSPFPVYCESTRKLYLPRYYGLSNFGQPKLNKLDFGEEINLNFPLSLKEKQIPIVEKYLEVAKNSGGGIISVPCGYGKTVIGLYLASVLKVKTLVVVHKEFLVNQWKERIKQFLPEARIGRLQSNKIFIENYDIVIGMLQSISMIEYNPEIFSSFGFVIYDECHHLGAETFSRALTKTGFKYTLGLSATPQRADGLTKVFQWHLGDICYQIKKRDDNDVNVKIIQYEDDNDEYSKLILNYNKKPNAPRMINNICNYTPRTNIIIREIINLAKEGRKILVLSDRREHLKNIKTMLDEKCEYTSGYYLGGMKEEELNITETKDIILGTFLMASEGFDCKYPLDSIVLTSPKSNIEQAVGRILRQEVKDRKFVPIVIDISDCFSLFKSQTNKRIKFYEKNKYSINLYDKENNKLEYESPKKKTQRKKKEQQCDLDFLPDD
jgi:superfamily II DNA or RNA helicase